MEKASKESAAEFASSSLGDVRRNARAANVVDSLVTRGGRSAARTCGSWAASKACYRLVGNPTVAHSDLLAGHAAATVARAQGRPIMLAAQDTTTLSFPNREVEGLGPVDSFLSVPGFFAHTALLIDPTGGEVLGVAAQEVWSRSWVPVSKTETDAERKLRSRESEHWGRVQEDVARAFGRSPGADGTWYPPAETAAHVIAVFDREGDIFEAMETLRQLDHGFVIRAIRNRKLKVPVDECSLSFDAVVAAAPLGEMTVQVPRGPGQKTRTATLSVRSVTLSLLPPKNRGRKGASMPVNMVLVREDQPLPDGTEPLCWYLLTSEPCGTLQDALTVVRYYKFRWKVEEFHMGLKTGCGIENVQFASMHALVNYLALAVVASWRLLALRDLSRNDATELPPDLLTEPQMSILRAEFPRLPPAPSPRQWLVAIAKLGGFFGRKSDGDPGWRTLWWGWKRLEDLERGWQLARARSGDE